jgi:MAF protein
VKTLVLASTSPFRKIILEKLNLAFDCAKPNVNETPLINETAIELVERLAVEKAKAVASQFPNALIIGSDQVALSAGKILGKPHNFENGFKQLSSFSGKAVEFHTGLCVFDSSTGRSLSLVDLFTVHFKELSAQEITAYLHAEVPYNCAGSFKSEGLGICLFEKLEGDDPNTLIGLPLIRLISLLKAQGLDVLQEQKTAIASVV